VQNNDPAHVSIVEGGGVLSFGVDAKELFESTTALERQHARLGRCSGMSPEM
jgi:hypothetical protein